MSGARIELVYGQNKLPIPNATAIMWRDEMHLDHVQIVIDRRERGSWSGMHDSLGVWLDGWLQGYFSHHSMASS